VRILYFSRDYTPHDHRFLTALAESEHHAFYLRLQNGGRELESRPIPAAVEQIHWQGGQNPARLQDAPALWWDLRHVIRRVKPDLIHAGPIQSCALLAALSGFQPLVSMSWGSDLMKDADQSARMRWATRTALRHTRILLADCQAVQHKAESFGFPKERTILFPWGVDLEHFQPTPAVEWNARRGWEDAFVLISVRSWEPLYGVDVLARAFVRAAHQLPELRLILLGNGSQASLIRQILEQGGVSDRVFFGGQVGQADLPPYYNAADLYISTSHSDGSSVSLLEALACGKPALISDIPANREWVTPSREGWWFADGSVDELTAGILRAYEMRSELARMGSTARQLVEMRADWKKNRQILLNAYKQARG
jgi:glycosyltransferase involved in cell wall biosynthesis